MNKAKKRFQEIFRVGNKYSKMDNDLGEVVWEFIEKELARARREEREKVLDFAIDVIGQYGYLDNRGFFYTDGGLSTLESAMIILWKNKVIKNQNRLRISEIKKYFKPIKKGK